MKTHSPEVVLHALSIRLAKRCRWVIQSCLREEEWRDADEEFYRIIREGLEEFTGGTISADGDANPTELTPEPP